MSRQAQLKFSDTLHSHAVGFASIPNLKPESAKKIQDNAYELLDVIVQQSEPWNKDQAEKTRKSTVQTAVAEWEDHYGKMADPEVQAAIDATVDAVRKHRAEQSVKHQAQEAIWKGQRKGTRRERHRAKRNRNVR
jgi:hypothetical protein